MDSIASNMDTTKTEDVMYLRLLKMIAKDKLYMPFSGNSDSVQVHWWIFYKTNDDYPLLAKAYYLLGKKTKRYGKLSICFKKFSKSHRSVG